MIEARSLLHRLLEYIVEQARDIDPRSYRLGHSRAFLARPEDLSGLPGVEFNLQEAGDHTWLRVQRLEPTLPPAPPPLPAGLLVPQQDPAGTAPAFDPVALGQYLAALPPTGDGMDWATQVSETQAALERQLDTYATLWSTWAGQERLRRRTIQLYNELFAMQHQLEADETAKPRELVWGIGVASWELPHPNGAIALEYPLLSQAMELSLDERSMAIEMRPRATDTVLELDPYLACQVPGTAELETTVRAMLSRSQDRPVSPFDPDSHHDILKRVAASLDSEGRFRPVLASGAPVPAPASHLVVTDSWALFLRPRATSYLTDDVQRLQAGLQTAVSIPEGPLALVTPPSDQPVLHERMNFRGVSGRGEDGAGPPQDLYFPLPYNQEQVTIVQRLEHAPGVTVQGPPGTGKTHTIANIICHYLATGRRVLVTARGETALRVLQQKIPAEVRALTVGLLASDRRGVRQFEAAVAVIQHRLSQLQPEASHQRLAVLRANIDGVHAEIQSIDQQLDEIARQQLAPIVLDGQAYTAQALALQQVQQADRFAWFDDALDLHQNAAPPLDSSAEAELRTARRQLGQDLPYVQLRTPLAGQLPDTAAIASLHALLAQIRQIEGEVARGELLPLQSTTPAVLAAALTLLPQLDAAIQRVTRLEDANAPWALALRQKCRNLTFASELAAFEALSGDIRLLVDARLDFLKQPVELLSGASPDHPRLHEAVARAAQTGKPLGLLSLGNSDLKTRLAAIRVAGLAPASAQDWQHVQRYLALDAQILSFTVRWNQIADTLDIPRLQAGVDALREAEQIAVTAQLAHAIATGDDQTLPAAAQAVFEHVPAELLRSGSRELIAVREHLARQLTRAELSQAIAGLGALQEQLAGTGGAVSARLRGFIDSQLGNPEVKAERVVTRYAELLAELRRIEGLGSAMQVVREACAVFERAGAPRLAHRLRTLEWSSEEASAPGPGSDPALPEDWRAAWHWARISGHLASIDRQPALAGLAERRREAEAGLAKLYRQLVAEAAWLATKENASPKVLQALAGYAVAIRKIGQGTGPNALRYRRDAREAMYDAAGAVPCWIMNHARVSESLPAELGRFDLVIVDEASQSDLWALPAVLRGKKILVVGDDRQVSPEAGFISAERILELRDRFLAGQPFGTEMTPEKSLYDLAARVFAAGQVMLREHFRSVTPIIDWSNRTFYGGAILPLRVPTRSERIDPPLIDLYVAGGQRDSKDRNLAEAEAIADEIVTILADPGLHGRTLGVVSLLGIEQAKTIDALVRSRCSALELQRRQFACGDARTFQGSERDILFLSLVVDPTNARALSGAMYEQRFNVAASRARDRMYLVRSVQATDLSGKDLRLSLLQHFEQPAADGASATGISEAARCATAFERELCEALLSLDYRVFAQVAVGAHRIDLVVEGAQDRRIAIECDGDEYHGLERWPHDMARQRVLERAGWSFWRCFASTWITRRGQVLAELVAYLDGQGITPIGGQAALAPTVEYRKITAASAMVALQHAAQPSPSQA